MQIYSDKCFKNPLKIIKAFSKTDFKNAIEQVEQAAKSFYVLGYIRYEAKEVFANRPIKTKLPLLYFEVYDGFEPYSPKQKNINLQLKTQPDITFEQYEKAIDHIKNQICEGNTYEVNYTYSWTVEAPCDEITLYESLLKNQKTPYNTFIKNDYETLLSFSPELFFELEGRHILTKPMKGTIKRGKTPKQDLKNIEFLKNDIKNRAENVMIVDLLRNDLSKIAKTGTVNVPKLFEIETHKTLHQMTSTIEAQLKDDTTLYDIFEAIFPCGSITGAPKISTMQIIDRVETQKRNIYCGAIGFLTPKKAVFSVPIRILQKPFNKTTYTCSVGGAIVWDSDTKDEWEETITKTKFLNNTQNDTPDPSCNFKLIETIKVENKEFVYGKEHFERLKNSAEKLNFKFNTEIFNLKPQKDGIFRLLLSKDGTIETEYKNLNPTKSNIITIAPNTVQSREKLLYHKTEWRPWFSKNEKLTELIKKDKLYDMIFFNEKGELTEGSRTNIVLEISGQMYTPKLQSGLLNGIMRQKLLKEGRCKEKILYKNDLINADKIFCINSVRGIKQVFLKEETNDIN